MRPRTSNAETLEAMREAEVMEKPANRY